MSYIESLITPLLLNMVHLDSVSTIDIADITAYDTHDESHKSVFIYFNIDE
jgi:hypothetical protein